MALFGWLTPSHEALMTDGQSVKAPQLAERSANAPVGGKAGARCRKARRNGDQQRHEPGFSPMSCSSDTPAPG